MRRAFGAGDSSNIDKILPGIFSEYGNLSTTAPMKLLIAMTLILRGTPRATGTACSVSEEERMKDGLFKNAYGVREEKMIRAEMLVRYACA